MIYGSALRWPDGPARCQRRRRCNDGIGVDAVVPVDPARLLVRELIDGAFGGVSGPILPDWNAS